MVYKNKKNTLILCVINGTPKGTRTPDSAVRGRRLNRLTIGAKICFYSYKDKYISKLNENQVIFKNKSFNFKIIKIHISYNFTPRLASSTMVL